jgi:hypothetical protein
MKKILTGLFCVGVNGLCAQNVIKLYYNSNAQLKSNFVNAPYLSYKNSSGNFPGPLESMRFIPAFSIAFQKLAKHKYQEIEIGTIAGGSFSSDSIIHYYDTKSIARLNPFTNDKFKANIGYERGVDILKGNKVGKTIGLYFGHSLQANFLLSDMIAKYSNYFPVRTHSVKVRYSLIPRVKAHLSKKASMDINLPFDILNTGIFVSNTDNPNLPLEQRQYRIFDLDAFEFLTKPMPLRIGFAYQL